MHKKSLSVKKAYKQKHASSLAVLHILIGAVVVYVLAVAVSLSFLLPKKPSIPCANTISCKQSLTFQVQNNISGTFDNHPVAPPTIAVDQVETNPNVLGAATPSADEKHIYVDLSKQMLYAYDGKTLFMQTPISSGKWFPTPDGDYKIWEKIRSTRMTGGSGADYYDLPNVPFVMFFYNDEVSQGDGFSLHGAYWHDNFGHPMSHGCINMRIIDAEKLYNWATPTTDGTTTLADAQNPGTAVTIYGTAP